MVLFWFCFRFQSFTAFSDFPDIGFAWARKCDLVTKTKTKKDFSLLSHQSCIWIFALAAILLYRGKQLGKRGGSTRDRLGPMRKAQIT